ncbi:MAG: extracellular solute-binding protein [Colwellia sp.]|nr:extracellular solute-binding protein [Colwellia sp.]
MTRTSNFLTFMTVVVWLFPINSSANENVVNVYSFRQAELITPLIDEFTKKTAIKVNLVSGKADKLMQRLIDDGNNSFADVLLTVDVARLEKAKQLSLIKPINSTLLHDNIPEDLRDDENFWFGLSVRVRGIFYAKDRVTPDLIPTYESLLNNRWQGKICSRKGSHMYNLSMLASFIYRYGTSWRENWVKNFSNNLAMRPNGGDRDQLRKIARGECDVAIANSYYYGMLSASVSQSDREVYQKIGIVLPNSNEIGSHINISGAALTSASKNKINAIKFIEFLTTNKAQEIYANNNYEYPIHPNMEASKLLKSWGKLTADTGSIRQLTKYHPQAREMVKRYSW